MLGRPSARKCPTIDPGYQYLYILCNNLTAAYGIVIRYQVPVYSTSV